jgi:hypothetical protein
MEVLSDYQQVPRDSDQEATTAHVAMVETPQHLEAAILMKLPQVITGNKGTGIHISQVNEIQAPAVTS